MDQVKRIIIDGVEYELSVPAPTTEPKESMDPIGRSEPFWSFLRSPQFWMIGASALASVLVRDDFATLPWNQIVGQIIVLWGGGGASFGLLNKVSKNLSTK